MGIENGSGIPVLNGEILSRGVILAEKIKNSGILGEKSEDERDIVDEKAREILDSSFEVKNAEGQIHNVEYTSVEHMIELSQSDGLTDDAKERARVALYELGLALSQDKTVFKAATEGEEELKKVLPPSLHGIQPYLLSSYLTDGKSDTEGQGLVVELTDLFKLKSRADKRPEYYRDDFESKAKGLFTKLMDKCDDATPEDVSEGRVGRWEAMMGFVKGIDDRTGREPVLSSGPKEKKIEEKLAKTVDKLTKAVDKLSSGPDDRYRQEQERYGLRPIMDADGNVIGMESNYHVSPENCAKAMKWMASDLRWSTWTPPEWFDHLPDSEKAKVLVMVAVNNAAANVSYAGKDLLKIFENNQIFSFTKEDMASLFDDDFKLVMSMMLNDLCEIVPDENGVPSLRYREVELPDGKRTIDPEVMKLLSYREDYKEELAKRLAKEKGHWKKYERDDKLGHKKGEFILDEKGEKIVDPNYLDLMTAYTAWNLFYGLGDSSTCDRLRILPTWNGIICDPIRTMKKAEYKAKNKWRVWKGGQEFDETEDLLSAEHFGGNMGDYATRIMEIERVLGPIDGKEPLKKKITRGYLGFGDDSIFYGFLDFVNGGRDLVKKEYGMPVEKGSRDLFYDKNSKTGSEVTLAQLLMNYAFRNVVDKDGKVIIDSLTGKPKREFIGYDKRTERRDFSFGLEQVTFMNEFRDSMEGGITAYSCITSKEDFKTVMSLVRKLKEKLPMVSDIEFNGKKAFSYTTSPKFWRNLMIGIFGYDDSRLSSDYIALADIANKDGRSGNQVYNTYVYDMMSNVMGLINGRDVDYYELAKLFGVQIERGQSFFDFFVTNKNVRFVKKEKDRTEVLLNNFIKKNDSLISLSEEKARDVSNWTSEIRSLSTVIAREGNYDLIKMERDFYEAATNKQYYRASRLYTGIKETIELYSIKIS